MITAPRYSGGVAPAPLPEAQRGSSATMENFGGGAPAEQQARSAEEISSHVGQLAKKAQDIALDEKDQVNKSVVLDLNVKAEAKKDEMTAKAKSLHGPDAVKNQPILYEEYKTWLQDSVKDLTPHQQEMAKRLLDSHLADFGHRQNTHAAEEIQKFKINSVDGNMKIDRVSVAREPFNQQNIDARKKNTLMLLKDKLKAMPGGPELDQTGQPVGPESKALYEMEKLQATSDIHMDVIKARVDAGKYISAQKYYDDNKPEIDVTKYGEQVSNLLKEGGLRGQAQEYATKILDHYMDRGALGPDGKSTYMSEIDKIDDPKLKAETTSLVDRAFTQRRMDVEALKKNNALDAYSKVRQSLAPARMTIPAHQWTMMDGAHQKAADAINNPPVASDDKAYAEFNTMDPGEIASMDDATFQTDYWSKMNPNDRLLAQAAWSAAREGASSPKLSQFTMVNEKAKGAFASMEGLPADSSSKDWTPKQRAKFVGFRDKAIRDVHDFEVNDLGGQRKATTEEVQKIMDGRLINGKPAYDPNKPFFNATPSIEDVPGEDLKMIRRGLIEAGRNSDDQTVLAIYRNHMAKKNGQ